MDHGKATAAVPAPIAIEARPSGLRINASKIISSPGGSALKCAGWVGLSGISSSASTGNAVMESRVMVRIRIILFMPVSFCAKAHIVAQVKSTLRPLTPGQVNKTGALHSTHFMTSEIGKQAHLQGCRYKFRVDRRSEAGCQGFEACQTSGIRFP